MFQAWLTSCVSCLWPQADQESKRPQTRQHIGMFRSSICPTRFLLQATHNLLGVEREMQVCHSQPHLVPPMKLVFYGDLPSPGGITPSKSSPSLPPWMHETRSLASRASQRASVLLARKKTQTRPTIGAPTDFRRVNPPTRRRTSFRPLELSIYSPGNRLSDLPEFSHFDMDRPGAPSPLPKALISPLNSAGHLRRDSGPFQLARKPVGSALSRRNSMATVELQLQQAQEHAQARKSLDAILLSPLIPHFSVLGSTDQPSTQQHVNSLLESERLVEPTRRPPAQNKPLPAEVAANMADTPFSSNSATLVADRSSFDHQRGNTISIGKKQSSQIQPLSSLRHNTASHAVGHHQSTKSSSTFQTHSRVRTTSNSTASSRTPSLSSAITAATTIVPFDKDIDGAYTALPMIPASVKNSVVVEEPQVHDEQEIVPKYYEYDQRFPLSPIGVAF